MSFSLGWNDTFEKEWIHKDAGSQNKPPCETWSEFFHPRDQQPSQND